MMLLFGLIVAYFISGIPGVLFARLLVATGLNRTLAVVAGSAIIPTAYVCWLTGFHLTGFETLAWIGPIAVFLGGVATSVIYFGTRK